MARWTEPDGLTPEDEAAADIRAAEEAQDNWLAEWSNDFWSDEYLAALERAREQHERNAA